MRSFPWKEVVAAVAVGLWSILSITDAVNNPFSDLVDKRPHFLRIR